MPALTLLIFHGKVPGVSLYYCVSFSVITTYLHFYSLYLGLSSFWGHNPRNPVTHWWLDTPQVY